MARKILSVLAVFMLAGCYVESASDRAPQLPNENDRYRYDSDSPCEWRYSRGCVIGNVPAMKIFVEGEEFHDANNLFHRFGDLVKVRDEEGLLLTPADYQLTMGTSFDNRSFAKGFEVYLSGGDFETTSVGTSGEFVLDELPEGRYEIRVQKPVKFSVARQLAVAVDDTEEPTDDDTRQDEPVEEPETEEVTKTYCATIYSDATVEVRRSEITRLQFSDFDLHITDRSCAEGARNSQQVSW